MTRGGAACVRPHLGPRVNDDVDLPVEHRGVRVLRRGAKRLNTARGTRY